MKSSKTAKFIVLEIFPLYSSNIAHTYIRIWPWHAPIASPIAFYNTAACFTSRSVLTQSNDDV